MKNQLIINNKEVELSPESWKKMEEQFKKKSFYPEDEEKFFRISFREYAVKIYENFYSDIFKADFDCGLAFKTRPEAEAKLAEMQAITKVRKFIFEEGLEFEPDYRDFEQRKYNIYYYFEEERFDSLYNNTCPEYSPFGYLKSEEDCEKVIENCKDELDVIFKVKK